MLSMRVSLQAARETVRGPTHEVVVTVIRIFIGKRPLPVRLIALPFACVFAGIQLHFIPVLHAEFIGHCLHLLTSGGNQHKGHDDDRKSGWKDGNRSGQGTHTFAKDDKYNRRDYTGQWENDKASGQGTMTWTNGAVYEGGWKDGIRSGVRKFAYILAATLVIIFRKGHGSLAACLTVFRRN